MSDNNNGNFNGKNLDAPPAYNQPPQPQQPYGQYDASVPPPGYYDAPPPYDPQSNPYGTPQQPYLSSPQQQPPAGVVYPQQYGVAPPSGVYVPPPSQQGGFYPPQQQQQQGYPPAPAPAAYYPAQQPQPQPQYVAPPATTMTVTHTTVHHTTPAPITPMQVAPANKTPTPKYGEPWHKALDNWCICFTRCDALCLVCWAMPIVSGVNLCLAWDDNICGMVQGCACMTCCCACNSADIEQRLGGRESGCCLLCLIHYCTPCTPCLIGREYVAVLRWKTAGRPRPTGLKK